eukprot:scaffold78943_cov66-Phaeocystis_antarctica.AAC.4
MSTIVAGGASVAQPLASRRKTSLTNPSPRASVSRNLSPGERETWKLTFVVEKTFVAEKDQRGTVSSRKLAEAGMREGGVTVVKPNTRVGALARCY